MLMRFSLKSMFQVTPNDPHERTIDRTIVKTIDNAWPAYTMGRSREKYGCNLPKTQGFFIKIIKTVGKYIKRADFGLNTGEKSSKWWKTGWRGPSRKPLRMERTSLPLIMERISLPECRSSTVSSASLSPVSLHFKLAGRLAHSVVGRVLISSVMSRWKKMLCLSHGAL